MKIYSFNELKESRLIYDRKPPAFGLITTFLTLFLVTVLLLLAGFSTKTYVVKASGLLTSNTKSYLMNEVASSITKVYFNEGDKVTEGVTVIELDTVQVDLQIVQLQAQADFLQNYINNYQILIDFINNYNLESENTLVNPFDGNNSDISKYYIYAENYISSMNNSTQDVIDGYKNQYTSSYYSAVDQYSYQLVSVNSQKAAYQDSLEQYKIKAETSGVLHYSSAIKTGTVLQAGSLIGSISSDNKEDLYFESVISAADISKIKTGCNVEIAISGIVQSEYGVLKGTLIFVDSDSTQTENGDVYYKIKIKPENTVLKDKKGNSIEISTGMISESRIKYDETTWLKWMLEQIGIKI
jgi:multidrug efflux pump subunit AcrA (membrane-fusion protein)